MTRPPGPGEPAPPSPRRPSPALPGRPAARTTGQHVTAPELAALAASHLARAQTALPGAHRGRLARWSDGVAASLAQRIAFASYWDDRNRQVLTGTGPLWVVLGDSTAQGLGAPSPESGYVGQARAQLLRRTGLPWRVLNLSSSGALTRDVLTDQFPRLAALPAAPDLLTCGVGANDVLHTPAPRLYPAIRELIRALPQQAVILDLPLPTGFGGIIGRISTPYVTRINQVIHTAASERSLPVARVSAYFTPPWTGKFAPDHLHPSATGYDDWTRALLNAVPQLS